MKKYILMLAVAFAAVFSSCTNDEIPVQQSTVIKVNPSTIMKNFTYQLNAGDLDGVDEDENIRVRLYGYNEAGVLSFKQEQSIHNYLTLATFELSLKEEETFKAVVIVDVTNDDPEKVSEYWTVKDEQSLSTLKVEYLAVGKLVYGPQEILGISTADINSGENTTINVESAGALILTYMGNLKAYSNVYSGMVFGTRGNGFYGFNENGQIDSNPNLEDNPYFAVFNNENSRNAFYTYKFLMPQTNYMIYAGFSDSQQNVIAVDAIEGITIKQGEEYLLMVVLDPNDDGSGTWSFDMYDVTGMVYGRSSVGNMESKIDVCQQKSSESKQKDERVYLVKDLIKNKYE